MATNMPKAGKAPTIIRQGHTKISTDGADPQASGKVEAAQQIQAPKAN